MESLVRRFTQRMDLRERSGVTCVNLHFRRGHSTQACWWKTETTQQHQQHQQEQAWYYPNRQQQWLAKQQSTAQASMQRQHFQVYNRPADSLRQLDSRQPTHVELRAPISSFNSTSVLSPSVYHSHAETLSTCLQQASSNLGNTCGHRCSNKRGSQELCFRYRA